MAEVWRFFAHEDDFADIDEAGACERLGRVLSFPTISSMDAEAVNWQPFDDLRAYMQQGLDKKEALKRTARDRGISKSEVYREALDL